MIGSNTIRSTLIIVATLLLSGCSDAMTDAEFIELFNQHRSDFEHLVEMMEADSATCAKANGVPACAVAIHAWGKAQEDYLTEAYRVSLQTYPKKTLTIDRLEQYILLTSTIPLDHTNLYFKDGEAIIGVYSKQFLVAMWGRDLIFRPLNPTPLEQNLDGWISANKTPSGRFAYRKIDDDWYIRIYYGEAWP